MFFEQICIHDFFQYPIFHNITFVNIFFVNNFVNGVFDDFENIHVLKNKNIKTLSIFYYHMKIKLVSPRQTTRLDDNIHI